MKRNYIHTGNYYPDIKTVSNPQGKRICSDVTDEEDTVDIPDRSFGSKQHDVISKQ
jgi:hypothetical protein